MSTITKEMKEEKERNRNEMRKKKTCILGSRPADLIKKQKPLVPCVFANRSTAAPPRTGQRVSVCQRNQRTAMMTTMRRVGNECTARPFDVDVLFVL